MNPESTFALIGAGLGVGALGSLHCIGMCGPFAVLAATRGGVKGTVAYSLGRLTTYAMLGILAGFFGAALAGLRTVGMVISVVLVLTVSLQIAGVIPEPRFAGRWIAPLLARVHRSGAGRYVLGAATSLLPCGLVYAALGVAMTAASPLVGALVMVAFGLGTVPLLSAFSLGAGRFARFGLGARRTIALVVAVTGIWVITHRVDALVDVSNDSEQEIPSCCHGSVSP